MMKQKICCLALISALLISITVPLIGSAKSNNISKPANSMKGFKVHVDASEVLRELGYTEENMSNVSRKLLIQIIRSYNVTAVLHDDGEYYATITPDSPRAEVNLIGSNRISPYDIDLSNPPDSGGYHANSGNISEYSK